MELVGGIFMRFLSYVIPFILRWYYTSEKLAGMMRVTVNSEHDGLVVNCGELPDAKIWLEITNQSPFPIAIQTVSVDLIWGARVGRFISIARSEVNPYSFERLFVETTLTGEQVAYIRKNHSNNTPRLSVIIELQCRIRSFALRGREITTKNFELMNCNAS